MGPRRASYITARTILGVVFFINFTTIIKAAIAIVVSIIANNPTPRNK
jgi:hypothetical protein